MDKYLLVPSDERYQKTPLEWMEFCYVRFMKNLGWNDIRDQNLHEEFLEEKKKAAGERLELNLQDMRRQGYTDEALDEITKVLLEELSK